MSNKKIAVRNIHERDRAEYIAMMLMGAARKDLAKKDPDFKANVAWFRQIRDGWQRDGVPIDTNTMNPNDSDYAQLLADTGATNFEGFASELKANTNGKMKPIQRFGSGEVYSNINKYSDDFTEHRKNNRYLHVVSDPDLRDHVFGYEDTPVPSARMYHEGRSVINMEDGAPIVLRNLTTDEPIRSKNGVVYSPTYHTTPITTSAVRSRQAQATPVSTIQQQQQQQQNATQQNATQQQNANTSDKGTFYLGWDGGELDGVEYNGLKHVLGAYFTDKDAEVIRKNFDSDALLRGDIADRAEALANNLRSTGQVLSVKPNSNNNPDYRNQLEVQLGDSKRTQIRLFDETKNGTYCGRVYDRYSTYTYSIAGNIETQNNVDFSLPDAIKLMNFAIGNEPGDVSAYANNKGSVIRLEGVDAIKRVVVRPVHEDVYKGDSFKDATVAEEFLQQAIDESNKFVQKEFRAGDMQVLIEAGLTNDIDTIMSETGLTQTDLVDNGFYDKEGAFIDVTSRGFKDSFETYYSNDAYVRREQELAIRDMEMALIEDGGLEVLTELRDGVVGTLEDGFNPSFVSTHMNETSRGNQKDAISSAIKVMGYDSDKIIGNDFATNSIKEKVIEFDPNTAKTIDQMDNDFLKNTMLAVQKSLADSNIKNEDMTMGSSPTILMDDKGIISWEGMRELNAKNAAGRAERAATKPAEDYHVKIGGQIGQIIAPDEHGIVTTNFEHEANYGFVPGYKGYFAYNGETEKELTENGRVSRMRAKGYEQEVISQVKAEVQQQMIRPIDRDLKNIQTTLGASALNGLYHGDVYGTRIPLDFMETNQMDMETKEAIVQTLSNKVRFGNEYGEHGTTFAELNHDRALEYGNERDGSEFDLWNIIGGENMRVLYDDLENIADLKMTGNARMQGMVIHLVDGANVDAVTGKIIPSSGMMDKDGKMVTDRTAVRKLEQFDLSNFDAWDREQMSANQLTTSERLDKGTKTAMMSFGGWTFEDSYVVSKEFADRNQIRGVKPNENSIEVLTGLLDDIEGLDPNLSGDALASARADLVKSVQEDHHMIWSTDVINEGLVKKNTPPMTGTDVLNAIDEFGVMGELHQYGIDNNMTDQINESLDGISYMSVAEAVDTIRSFEEYDLDILHDAHMRKALKDVATVGSVDVYQDYLDENGTFRELRRGDKLSDFHGNKGTISIVIDRDMPEAEAKAQDLEKEVAYMKANPSLDAITGPYSMLSRHNAGVVKEMASGELEDVKDPYTGEVYKNAIGELDLLVTDMAVDRKTKAYTQEDVLDGKGRMFSAQLAWIVQAKDATGILQEVYGDTDEDWKTLREYFITTGLDMGPDGTMRNEYTPHYDEVREVIEHDVDISASDFLANIGSEGAMLELPFDLDFKASNSEGKTATNTIPILPSSLRQDTELVDGSMKHSDHNKRYMKIYEASTTYKETMNKAGDRPTKEQAKTIRDSYTTAKTEFNKIQDDIIDRHLDGGPSGKHGYMKNKIMGTRMKQSATSVAIGDPRLQIGDVSMNQDMLDALGAKEGDTVMMFRDPVMRDGAARAMTVIYDETVEGVGFHPSAASSHDGDFDGDTYGVIKFNSEAANKELKEKFSHENNLLDKGNGKDELAFGLDMDVISGQAGAEAKNQAIVDNGGKAPKCNTPKELIKRSQERAQRGDMNKEALADLEKALHLSMRENGYGGAYVDLTDDESALKSFTDMQETGAKGTTKKQAKERGGPTSVEQYKRYQDGICGDDEAREIQKATGIKTDATGIAGAKTQELVALARNYNISAALEATYPLTQSVLQIKKDATHGERTLKGMVGDLATIYRGRDVEDPKKTSNPSKFRVQLKNVMDQTLGVSVADEHIDVIADLLTDGNGALMSLEDAIVAKGAPMDKVVDGGKVGGFEQYKQLASTNSTLLEGKYNKMFAPDTMKNATPKTTFMKGTSVANLTPGLVPAEFNPDSSYFNPKQVEHEILRQNANRGISDANHDPKLTKPTPKVVKPKVESEVESEVNLNVESDIDVEDEYYDNMANGLSDSYQAQHGAGVASQEAPTTTQPGNGINYGATAKKVEPEITVTNKDLYFKPKTSAPTTSEIVTGVSNEPIDDGTQLMFDMEEDDYELGM